MEHIPIWPKSLSSRRISNNGLNASFAVPPVSDKRPVPPVVSSGVRIVPCESLVLWFMFGLLLLSVLVAPAQTSRTVPAQLAPLVVIGSTTVRLGAPADAVTAQLQRSFEVSNHGTPPVTELWVTTKQEATFPMATVYVRNHVVIGIAHEILEHEIESTDDIFDALFKATSKFVEENRSTCRIETGTGYIPGPASISKAIVKMYCGQYRLVVLKNTFSTTDDKLVSGYIVREELGETD